MFGKRKKLTFHGCDHEKLEQDALFVLCDLEDDIVMTEREKYAMDIAIQAVTFVMNGMVNGGKVEYD